MKPIQFILVPLLILLLVIFIPKLKKHGILRLLFAGVILTALVFTIFLDSSMILANSLGIGRGVDLVIYFALLGLTVSSVLLYLRTVRLQEMITELIRQQALEKDGVR